VRYRTIVADPPWAYPDDHRGLGVGRGARSWSSGSQERHKAPYTSQPVEWIAALPVADLAADDAHLYLWATSRHLPFAFGIAEGWGFRYAQILTWAKYPGPAMLGGAFAPTTEFVLFCRRGSLPTRGKTTSTWFSWPRNPPGAHSRKPEAFLDLVERVSPGPYLELFARRQRLGWDTWGNEALEHVAL
jgi:N6-adenosine-specific RNA methylase IME4